MLSIYITFAALPDSTTEKTTTPQITSTKAYLRTGTPEIIFTTAAPEEKYEKPVPVVYPPEEAQYAQAIGIPSLCLLVFEFVSLFIMDLTSIALQAGKAKRNIQYFLNSRKTDTTPVTDLADLG